ncbi:hypothetical protein LCGC14_2315880, partial [marine sediment metagenome]
PNYVSTKSGQPQGDRMLMLGGGYLYGVPLFSRPLFPLLRIYILTGGILSGSVYEMKGCPGGCCVFSDRFWPCRLLGRCGIFG